MPIVCPVCWDHAIQPVEGVELVALYTDEPLVVGGQLGVSNWHMFAAHVYQFWTALIGRELDNGLNGKPYRKPTA